MIAVVLGGRRVERMFLANQSAGSSVRLTHGETLTTDGEFTSDTFGDSRQQVRYTLAGTDGTLRSAFHLPRLRRHDELRANRRRRTSAHTGRSRARREHRSRSPRRSTETVFGRTGALNATSPPSYDGWATSPDASRAWCRSRPATTPFSCVPPTAWADACVDVPWTLYLHYGDHLLSTSVMIPAAGAAVVDAFDARQAIGATR